MRMVSFSANSARANGSEIIDQAAAEEAIKDMRLDLERLLIPRQIFYPLLANIHRTKRDWFGEDEHLDVEKLEICQQMFRQLLFNGIVAEYNGDHSFFDVHPVALEISGLN